MQRNLQFAYAMRQTARTHQMTHVSTDELIEMIKEGRNVPRKGHIQKRDVLADPLYNDKVVQADQ